MFIFVVGLDYECLYVDIGINGMVFEGDVWNKCGFLIVIENDLLFLLLFKCFFDGLIEVFYIFVGNDVFFLKYLMKFYF